MRHTEAALATVAKIMALVDNAQTATSWNTTLLTVRETRRWVEHLMMQLNHAIER